MSKPSAAKLRTIRQFSSENDAFSEPSLRWLIHNEHHNGLSAYGAVVRLGRRVYINAPKFFDWVESRNPPSNNKSTE